MFPTINPRSKGLYLHGNEEEGNDEMIIYNDEGILPTSTGRRSL
jgi:hypothetical protein